MDDQIPVHIHSWYKEKCNKDIILILHGMAEHAFRYNKFAEFMVENGYQVVAPDHRGHGETGHEAGQLGHFADEKGWARVIKDIDEIIGWIKKENPDKRIILLGHSMGSLLARTTMANASYHLKGAIISGTTLGGSYLKIQGGRLLTKAYISKKGSIQKAELLDKISFGQYNKKIRNTTSKFDWLSSDPEQVKAYDDDKFCGFLCSAGLFRDLLKGVKITRSEDYIKAIPKDLPIFLIAGDQDPAGNYSKDVMKLYKTYIKEGLTAQIKIYEGGRHEMLNEMNYQDVFQDVLKWINKLH